ncbi:MAG: hypothetical protein OEX19_02990 [Gammaproteobacteria bacterium]|nr:hypothetical protein [Gammaproteobacteria bacterium]
MIDELKKSVGSILYERVASPLYGTFFISWLIWNWKIIYLTLFIKSDRIDEIKIDYIVKNYADIHFLVTLPVISTALLLILMPFVTNGAYWLHLKFYKWRSDKKNEVEMKQLLTLEQSIQLREEIANKENTFETLLTGKNDEIKRLTLELETVRKQSSSVNKNEPLKEINRADVAKEDNNANDIANKIIKSQELHIALDKLAEYIQGGYSMSDAVDTHVLGFYESNNLVVNKGNGTYEFTDLGKKVYKNILDRRFE